MLIYLTTRTPTEDKENLPPTYQPTFEWNTHLPARAFFISRRAVPFPRHPARPEPRSRAHRCRGASPTSWRRSRRRTPTHRRSRDGGMSETDRWDDFWGFGSFCRVGPPPKTKTQRARRKKQTNIIVLFCSRDTERFEHFGGPIPERRRTLLGRVEATRLCLPGLSESAMIRLCDCLCLDA